MTTQTYIPSSAQALVALNRRCRSAQRSFAAEVEKLVAARAAAWVALERLAAQGAAGRPSDLPASPVEGDGRDGQGR